jgi:hypothetical protein
LILFFCTVCYNIYIQLDATSEELVGVSVTSPLFRDKFISLLNDISAGRVLLVVCDRFDESLLVLQALGIVRPDALPIR